MANSLTDSLRTITTDLVKNLHAEQVFANLTDGKFLAGLKGGVAYPVPSASAVNTGTYDGTAITRQKATDTKTTVTIDGQDYFDVELDEPDGEQATAQLMDYVEEGKYALAQDFDAYIATGLIAGAGTTDADVSGLGTSGAKVTVTEATIFDYLGLYKTALKKANANLANSALVLNADLATMLQNARAGAGSDAGTNEQANGWVDKILGLKVYESNALTNGEVLAFEKRAYKWRDSMTPLKSYEPDETFGTAVKGLHVYGGKVIAAIDNAVVLGYVA